ncbi:MAG TPA: VacB/RNase II family 3'-5' exoribonuclease [Deltaproteobacteria bacterium]|nr:VacB/RNase II family 3'-5' exoribonuclease [Deltaproteobacteria bacterium]
MRVQGKLSWNPKGFAFVVTPSGPDVFVPGSDLMSAMDGDTVEVEAYHDRKGMRGRIVSILERATITLSGRYRRAKKWGTLEPNRPFPYTIIIPHGCEAGARSGDLVIARIEPPKHEKRIDAVAAQVVQSLSFPDDIGEDLRFVATKHGLPWLFPAEVEAQARTAVDADPAAESGQRRDLRDRVLFTVDGAAARDFDDAVGIEPLADGSYRLTVAIADVAAFVKTGTVLDQEAFNRSFSVYFPEACIPMLPEVLSNGVCSLNPDVDRLAMVVEMRLGPRGKLLHYDCFEAVIHSWARLTYGDVDAFLDGKGTPPKADARVLQALKLLKRVTGFLHARRRQSGSLDFDLPERDIELDSEGLVGNIYRRQRGSGERLIEEAMLMANLAVCRFLHDRDLPALYRVHDMPAEDDLFDLLTTLSTVGVAQEHLSRLRQAIAIGKGLNKVLQAIAESFQDDPREAFIHQQILRSLRQAKYQHEDVGHFGLAFTGYLHFTSPIRRYPDLIVHRLVKAAIKNERLSKKEFAKWQRYLKFVGPEVSRKERVTNEAMLEVIKLKTAAYMARRVGEEFPGVVTSIMPFGVFVQIADPPTDGLIGAAELGPRAKIVEGRYVRMRKKTIALGEIVRVRVIRVDPIRGLIDLALAKSEEGASRPR